MTLFRSITISTYSLLCVLALAPYALAGGHGYKEGEVIVKLKGKGNSLQSKSFFSKAGNEKELTLKGSWSSLNMHHYQGKPGQTTEQIMADLNQDPNVEYVEPNYIISKTETALESAQSYSQAQVRTFSAPGSFTLTSAQIHASEAWGTLTVNSNRPVVAVIDTGIDLNHISFGCKAIWKNTAEINGAAGVDDDGNGYVDDFYGWNFVNNNNNPMDDDGHGTHVSGIILGTGQDLFACGDATNQAQRDAAESKVRIMPLKFLDGQGNGTTADAIKAIYYAVNNGAKVLNNSWGGSDYSRALNEAIAYSYQAQVLFVAAAGNASQNNDSLPMYPANYDVPNMISVAATTGAGGFAYFSNFGSAKVHVGSPGVSILSSYPGNNYGYLSGTSMAAPFVSGVAAVMLRESPQRIGYQVKQLIMQSGNVLSSLSSKVSTQKQVDVYNAAQVAKTTPLDFSQPVYAMSLSSQDRGLASSIASAGAGCGMVSKLNSGGGGFGGGALAVGALLLLPIFVLFALKNKLRIKSSADQRKYERFQIDSKVELKVGDQKIIGDIQTISLGGAAIDIQAMIEKGSVVSMKITPPEGGAEIEVQGHVVWGTEEHKYGVQFDNLRLSTLQIIAAWTRSLLKAN